MEGKEKKKEKKKKKKERWGGSGTEEGGAIPQGSKAMHPFPINQGLLVLAACQQMMIQHILSAFVAVSKFHEMNMFVLYLAVKCGQ
jgi:hypothetical protein